MFKRYLAILKARMIEYRRDRAALLWSFFFPFSLVCGFGLMFSGDGKPLYKVGLIGDKQQSVFLATKHLQFIDYQQSDQAQLKLQQHALDLLVDISARHYWVNESSASGYIVEKLLLASEPGFSAEVLTGRQIRYIDWLVPGILGMNMMFGCLFGVGFAIVRYRKNLVLKRLGATPLKALEFILAQVTSRLIIVLISLSIVYSGCNLLFDFYMIGSYFNLMVVAMLGAMSIISLALIIASRLESEDLTSGLLNLCSFSMMILSGVWFSLEGTPEFVQTIASFVPLTHILEAARAVMQNGDSLWDLRNQLAILAGMTVLFTSIAALLFRWDGDSR